jgi:hypothetical protein
MSSEANSRGDECSDADACNPTKEDADTLTKDEEDERRAARLVNLIIQRSAMRPGEVVEMILPDDEEDDYVEDPYFLHADGTPDLEKILPNSDDNPIEYIYTRDATGRVVHVDSRYKQGRGKEKNGE